MPEHSYDVVIVGGGFFGCSLAVHLQKNLGRRVILLEKTGDLLQRASYSNQARVHNGYHYPRSLLTALRCRINFPRFIKDYEECIVRDFDKYYAIGRLFSKVSANQFRIFCERFGAPIASAPMSVKRLFNPDLIEEVFAVTEYAFDAVKLKNIMIRQLQQAGVTVCLQTEARHVCQVDGTGVELTATSPNGDLRLTASQVFNCTYSRLNKLLVDSGLRALYLKHELTEMALIEPPEEIRDKGITLMCGSFFSTMPFPPFGLHTLSHVRYTPHCEWRDEVGRSYTDPYAYLQASPRRSNYVHMIKDAARYLPCLSESRYVDSIWEIKTLLPKSEMDDSRPVLYKTDCGLRNLTCLMGGKIDNIYDVIEFENAAHARCDQHA